MGLKFIDTTFPKLVDDLIINHNGAKEDISRADFIEESVKNKEVLVAKNGTLASWTYSHSTGRSPLDTVSVRRPENEDNIDWKASNNIAITEEVFDMLYNDALEMLSKSENVYITNRVIGADSNYALPVKTISNKAITAVFVDNMFRPIPDDINNSIFKNNKFTLLVCPENRLDTEKYYNILRKKDNGKTSDMIVAVDYERCLGVVVGSSYNGSVKKMLFTVMNYYLPFYGILPLHCSANEGANGRTALLLGLSGTGKTTLSADPDRALLGDDEHGWSDNGIANFENGCYAKMIDIVEKNEPEIWKAVMHEDDYRNHGAIVENAMLYPNGEFDFFDDRITPNSRASYPLSFLSNIKQCSTGGHPSVILFLTADAYGVLPPISKLNIDQAKLWFLMGYTSKLAGTETGVIEPQTTFSRFFGQPFMPCKPSFYSRLLGEKMVKHNTSVYLINTGWIGGPYGVGKRISLKDTRAMVNAALNGDLENVEYREKVLFHVNIPVNVPGVAPDILFPEHTWENKNDYKIAAHKLANAFSTHFDKVYGDSNVAPEVRDNCPGKNFNFY